MGVAGNDSYFYHGITTKIVTVFGAFFNDIRTARKLSDGTLSNMNRVPLSYGSRSKFLARINNKRNDAIAIKLPRMSFELTGMSYDSASKINSIQQRRLSSIDEKTRDYLFSPVPYELTFELNIFTRTMDDALQILEQILPTFKPEYTVTIKDIEGPNTTADVMFKIDNISLDDEGTGDWLEPRALVYTLTFSTKVNYIGSIRRQRVIERAMAVFRHTEQKHDLGEATIENLEEPKSFISELNMDDIYIIEFADNVAYTIGENVIGETTGYAGLVKEISENTIKVKYLDNMLEVGENLIGESSGEIKEIVNIYNEKEFEPSTP